MSPILPHPIAMTATSEAMEASPPSVPLERNPPTSCGTHLECLGACRHAGGVTSSFCAGSILTTTKQFFLRRLSTALWVIKSMAQIDPFWDYAMAKNCVNVLRVPQWLEPFSTSPLKHGISLEFSSWEAGVNSLKPLVLFAYHDSWLVGGLEHQFYFPIYWELHHPNWLSYFSEGWPWPTNQLMIKSEVFPQWFGCQVAITNCGTSLIAGCVTFPVLGRQWLWPWP